MTESWDFLLLFLAGGAIGAVLGALFARQRPSARHLAEIEQLQSRVLALTAESAALQATLAREQAVSAEKLALLETARDQLANAFKAISADALRSNNQQFLDLARTQLETFQAQARTDLETRQRRIDDSLKPIRESLDKFDVQVRDLEKNRAVAYQSMTEQVQQLMREQVALRSETSNLVGALRQPTVRGRWGEIQLRRVVELAGMLDHCDFREQHSIDSEEGKLRPDLIIHLPRGRSVIVDSKVPLAGYLAALEARDDATRTLRLQEHAKAVKGHLAALSRKGYAAEVRGSAEFVVLFLPGEVFFSAALEQDPALIEAGVEQGVMIATPTSLIALLRAVAYGWRQEEIARNAEKISTLGKDLYDRLSVMGEHWVKVGKGIRQAVDGYNSAINSLESRVMVTARRLRDLDPALDPTRLEPIEPVDVTPRPLRDETVRLSAPEGPSN
ncbi:MAG: DNA recombination protein RmuC [Gammaproteobacteria bacterium]|jgi:DNA recombination protein RmuC|nr:DNA recombination protein RmuC [Gammaproteobacteria bacterium]NCW56383.1 DNA recombination protein RmuC [Gammaproteobacteria bacterium]NDA42226.1 DNA recombination protein RmuC [Gammaproteobacteria bacterium]NDB15313.1 DNA recombination protein RmuC [Gammaproteobacteria bacterium]